VEPERADHVSIKLSLLILILIMIENSRTDQPFPYIGRRRKRLFGERPLPEKSLMSEMADAGENHRHLPLVSGSDHFLISN
jgi:hypothetical protein